MVKVLDKIFDEVAEKCNNIQSTNAEIITTLRIV